ncbi:non-canonical purine NTP diphosphatase [Flavobacterium silvaticum]|uniref:dITP/XTP pyrophosphatase n=1 Tax=Flavobacterium silvaticum TaxID=1852020 RepID=A0A972FIV7_9FLAO|nr:non-canonical purine NTP diphosphatase [Flavobacterium silvaticum]NMH26776.1 non-canonical purine NTP diphosphatase [Flavobacterium silvaticum]
MKLLFASQNQHKIEEIRAMLPGHIELISLSDIGSDDDIPETADTLEGNAILKANFVSEKYNPDCFADDTGLEVEALNNAPGVYSARYAGEQKNASDNIKKLLSELDGKPNRSAQFKTVIALNLNGNQHLFEGIVRGKITYEPIGNKGFGYDPVFIPEGYDRTFAQMEMYEKAKMSHRGRALGKLIDFLNSNT